LITWSLLAVVVAVAQMVVGTAEVALVDSAPELHFQ
jgi:hypothetical protein